MMFLDSRGQYFVQTVSSRHLKSKRSSLDKELGDNAQLKMTPSLQSLERYLLVLEMLRCPPREVRVMVGKSTSPPRVAPCSALLPRLRNAPQPTPCSPPPLYSEDRRITERARALQQPLNPVRICGRKTRGVKHQPRAGPDRMHTARQHGDRVFPGQSTPLLATFYKPWSVCSDRAVATIHFAHSEGSVHLTPTLQGPFPN